MRGVRLHVWVLATVALLLTLAFDARSARAEDFTIASPACEASELITRVAASNGNNQNDSIDLNGCVITLTDVDNSADGANGLPSITEAGFSLTIRNGTIQRTAGDPDLFRIVHIASTGTLMLQNVTISGGNGPNHGGGIFSTGTLNVTNSTISGNTVAIGNGSEAFGGGLYLGGGTTTITNSTISGNAITAGNSSQAFGGGLYISGGTTTMTNSTVSGNSATATAQQADNTGGTGGGFYVRSGTATIVHSTISNNTATGGPTFNGSQYTGGGTLRATIFDRGSAGTNCFFGGRTSLGSNIADDTTCDLGGPGDQEVAFGTIRLGLLADNGGPTRTHALLTSPLVSPAIDAVQGLCNTTGQPGGADVLTDQRGRTRPQDGDAAGAAICDIGAYERAPGKLQFGNASYTVTEAGPNPTITVTRTDGSEGAVSATVTVGGGASSAAPGADYTGLVPFQVTFTDGDTAPKTFNIAILQDTADEPDETVLLTLSAPTGGATIGAQGTATLTIQDDDAPPTVSVGNVTVPEGNAGSTNATFQVTLSPASGKTVTVQAQTADGAGATGAVAGTDYTNPGIVNLTFTPGETVKTVDVAVLGDTVDEPDKTFTLGLNNLTNATIGIGTGTATIADDDGPPSLGIAITDATETDAGNAIMTFAVTLAPPSGQAVTVQFATQNGTAPGGAVGGATCAPGVDYLTTSGLLTFQPSQTQQTIPVTVCADTLTEGDETFFVNLTNPTQATIADGQGRGTIRDDDEAGTLAFTAGAVSVPENAGSVTLTVQRTGSGAAQIRSSTPVGSVPGGSVASGSVRPSASSNPTVGVGAVRPAALSAVTVNYSTANVEALAGQDYTAAAGTIAFGVNETTKTIVIPVSADSLQEGPESFTVLLSTPTGGAALGTPAVAIVTIIDTTHGAPTPPGDDSADDEREERERETEEERRQRARTNQGNKDDDSVEGDVIEVRCDQPWPAVVIANRDGLVEVRLVKEAQKACSSIAVGDYLEADGEKQHEFLFDATDISIR